MIEGALPIAFALRRYRVAAGLARTKLAEKIGCDARGLAMWENGHNIPSLQNATDWANALGFNLVLLNSDKQIK